MRESECGRRRRRSARRRRARRPRAPSNGHRSMARRGRPRGTRSCASDSSSEPGSVTTANCSGFWPAASQKCSRWDRVSSVVPDLEEATETCARRRSTPAAVGSPSDASCRGRGSWPRRSCAGRPPAPGSTHPSRAGRSARTPRPARRQIELAKDSSGQPSHSSSSEPVETDVSRAQIRSTSPCPASCGDELAALRVDPLEQLGGPDQRISRRPSFLPMCRRLTSS